MLLFEANSSKKIGRPSKPKEGQPDTRQKIIGMITEAGKDGIYQKDLLSQLQYSLDRTTVFRVCRKYAREGLIQIKVEKGRRTRYISTNQALSDANLGAYLHRKEFIEHILGHQDIILSDLNEFDFGTEAERDFSVYKRYFQFTSENGKSPVERTLFELSNQLGAYVMYFFIQTMNSASPVNRKAILQTSTSNTEPEHMKQEQSTQSISEYLAKAISSGLFSMLWRIRDSDLFFRLGYSPGSRTERAWKKTVNLGILLDKKHFKELSVAFANLYPRLYYELEKIQENLPSDVDGYKQRRNQHLERKERQEKCKHEFRPEPLEPLVPRIGEECFKCGFARPSISNAKTENK